MEDAGLVCEDSELGVVVFRRSRSLIELLESKKGVSGFVDLFKVLFKFGHEVTPGPEVDNTISSPAFDEGGFPELGFSFEE